MKGLGALQRHQLPHPPCKNPGSATVSREMRVFGQQIFGSFLSASKFALSYLEK